MAKLTAAARKRISTKNFAIPSKARTSKQKAKSGNYPIEDKGHAVAALSRSSGKSVEAQVKAKVYAKYPGLKKRKAARGRHEGASIY